MKTLSSNETWFSLYAVLRTTLELGQKQAEVSSTFLQSLIASDMDYVEGMSRLGTVLQESPKFLDNFNHLPGTLEGKPLIKLLETYDRSLFLKNIKHTNIGDIKVANDIKDEIGTIYAQAAGNDSIEISDDAEKKDGAGAEKKSEDEKKEPSSEHIKITTKGGTVIEIGGSSKKEGGDGDDPRDKGKPKLYGEEINAIAGKCGISIHKIECIEDDDTEDDIIYSVRTQQEFKDFDILIVNFVSDLHEDIDEGEILSTFDAIREEKDTRETQLKLYDEDRCCLRYYGKANEDGMSNSKFMENTKGFNLDKFIRCVVDIRLMDGSTSFFEYLSKILEFLTLIGAVGFDIFQITSVNQLISKISGKPNPSALKELREWFTELLDESKTNLGSAKLIVSHDEFKSKIEAGPLTVAEGGAGFKWIEGVSRSVTGHPDADYKVTLRYESFD